MKRFTFLPVAAIVALMVTIVSCGMPMNTQGGYYEDAPTARSRYYGNNNVIVVERDPFTGQYYQVTPTPYDMYSTSPYGYTTPYDSRYYNYRNRNTTYYPRNRQVEQPRQKETYKATPQERDDSRKRVLGSRNN